MIAFVILNRDVFGIAPADDSAAAVEAAVLETVDRLQAFFIGLGMPRNLGEFGLDRSCIDRLLVGLEKSKGREFGAFKKLGPEDARAIYESAMR